MNDLTSIVKSNPLKVALYFGICFVIGLVSGFTNNLLITKIADKMFGGDCL